MEKAPNKCYKYQEFFIICWVLETLISVDAIAFFLKISESLIIHDVS